MAIRIGISGWRYAPWRGRFYPEGLPQRCELDYASRSVASIEINGSFYSLQSPASWSAWRRHTPGGFRFAVKGPRYITHILRLREPTPALANFFASGVLCLGDTLGPLLWQLPPSLRYAPELIERFLALLPRDTDAALALGRRRQRNRMRGRTALPGQPNRPLRHALEIRHDSFLDEAFVGQLRRHGVALVVSDSAGRFPHVEDVTADFLYLRLHGDTRLYTGRYSDPALERWAARIRRWADGHEPDDARRISGTDPARRQRRDVYCYFDNDAKVDAPFDAQRLYRLLAVDRIDRSR
ncbi:DUF72 domain-containing protein [Xanthomonas sp. XNM01]|uniref:DUF72 domain-containing protein n=1 Tax=Xanthomonas sp. XNM01 TaxID=2769289 RepID=UPI001782382F|nr:DUF72 domain-containing protein [Xanthomonas sp. XNM01]MBD9367786.1 DUF72 domain-containing protein [Xanthomonas sp. XNM01]